MQCESPAFRDQGQQCPGKAEYNLATHDFCYSNNLCDFCAKAMILGTISAFQDKTGPTYCPGCDKEIKHLEEMLVLTQLDGVPLEEAWREFNTGN